MRAIATMRKSAAAPACQCNWMKQQFPRPKPALRDPITGAQMGYSSANGRPHSLDKRSIGLDRNTALGAKVPCLKRLSPGQRLAGALPSNVTEHLNVAAAASGHFVVTLRRC